MTHQNKSDHCATWIERHARARPAATALIDCSNGREYSWSELRAEVSRAAAFLSSAGISHGDRVALLAPNCGEFLCVMAACARLGAIFTPLNWRLSHEELSLILGDADPKIWLVHESMMPLALSCKAPCPISISSQLQTFEPRFSSTLAITDDAPAWLIYTSGTTSQPRGVVLSHRAIRENAEQFVDAFDLSAKDINYASAPLFHIAGLATITVPLLLVGGCSAISASNDPEEQLEQMREANATCSFQVPTVWRRMLDQGGLTWGDLPAMRFGLVGGAPCPGELRARCEEAGVPLHIGYGMTELAPMVTLLPATEDAEDDTCVGAPGERVSIEVRDPSNPHVKCPPGEVGQVYINAPNMFDGYWQGEDRPLDTSAIHDGWFASGDLGQIDEDGRLILAGRKHDMIITGGENVYPGEVERALLAHLGSLVEDLVVFGAPHEDYGEQVCCALVLAADVALDEARVIEEMRAHLAGYKIPRMYFTLPELPRNGTGKIDRAALRNLSSDQDGLASNEDSAYARQAV